MIMIIGPTKELKIKERASLYLKYSKPAIKLDNRHAYTNKLRCRSYWEIKKRKRNGCYSAGNVFIMYIIESGS